MKININWTILFWIFGIHLILNFAVAQDTIPNFIENDSLDFEKKIKTKKKLTYLHYTHLRPSYNSFIGEDAKLMTTTFKGLGSLSEWNLVLSYPFLVGKKATKFLILPRAGFLWKKFRFANPLITYWDTTTDKTVFYVNNDLKRDYGNSFFSYGKTKLVVSTFRVNPEMGVSFDIEEKSIGITVGPVLDVLLRPKYKQKYTVEGQKKKEVLKGNQYLNVNPIQYGVSAALMTPWADIYGAYFFNNFFTNNHGPKVRLLEFGIIFSFLQLGF